MKKLLFFTLILILSLNCSAQSSNDFRQKMSNTSWKYKDGFKYPAFMKHYPEKFIDDIPASVEKWGSGSIELCYWPGIGSWATDPDAYPEKGSYLSDKVFVRNITYRSGKGIYSGYTSDGRIFYMRVNIACGLATCHAFSLILIYPKHYQSDVTPLINIIKDWKLK